MTIQDHDLFDNINLKRGLSPVAATTDNTAYVSQILDMQGLSGAVFAILTGSLADADATFAVTVDEGDAANLSDAASVNTNDLLGTLALASFTFAADDSCFKIGVRASGKRYKRVTITPSNNTGNAFINGVWITAPLLVPAPNPPA
ncbi:hypothetical protein MA20_31905 [Bradyrhizobium japonicum]|uniref:Uncharacterized protein n=1 Tax=Bradyrhizobium japonicum TaxID=375 RepID=A0A0A3XN33_BRAJP|nr:hypothetical protein [Bradyrhizobium japonicum]KGT75800.1 hypothetical protein MA20_31905 [Bradyrhizobium japonicum]